VAGPIRIAILANGAQARREIGTVDNALGRIGRLAVGGLAAAGIYGLTRAVIGFGTSSVTTEAKFSTSMRLIQAATSATSSQMGQLNDLAIDLGAKTSFSASEAADAMLELAKAGLDTKTIMGGGVAGTLQLAAAGGTELGTAAEIASNALNAFNLQGKDMAAISAALAGGANASSASVESLGLGLSQVGAGAVNAGLSLQETVAALSAFDAAGIKGSDAGTSLKTMLQRLVPQTTRARDAMADLGLKYTDAQGNFLPLAQIAQRTQDAFKGLSQEQRTAALTTIFGSDASRAATVLMREGAKGVEQYTKAASDQSAAQKMAAARMGGTAGALERLNGTIETAKLRLGQELAPAVEAGADALGANLVPAMETAIDGGKDLVDAVKPAVLALADLVPSAEGAGHVFNDLLVPALSQLSDLVAGVAGFIDDLPGPLKTMGVEAGIAALVMPRLAAGFVAATAAVRINVVALREWSIAALTASTRSTALGLAALRIGPAMKAAAGVGGLVALTEGAKQSNTALSTLEITLGAAAVGFSVGGPIGAGVGGLAGLVFSLSKDLDRAGTAGKDAYRKLAAIDPVDQARSALDSLKDTLDQVTGAYTESTRAAVLQKLQQSGLIDVAARYGISSRQVVNAALGQTAGFSKLRPIMGDYADQIAAVEAQQTALASNFNSFDDAGFTPAAQARFNALEKEKKGLEANLAQLRLLPGALRDEATGIRASAAATADYTGKLKGIPKRARTAIEAAGIIPTARGIGVLAAKYRLLDKQKIRTLIEASGADVSVRQIQRVIAKINQARTTRGDLDAFTRGVQRSAAQAEATASKGGANIVGNLRKALLRARADFPQLNPSIRQLTNSAAGIGSTGGHQVGSQMQAGIISGFSGTLERLSAMAAAAVHAAVAAAKAAAKVKSPSRETEHIGRMLGEGLIVGMRSQQQGAKDGGHDLVAALLTGVVNGSKGVDKALEKVEALVRKRVTGKHDEKRENAILKALRDQFKALDASGKAQDQLNHKLDDARQSLKDLQDQATSYAATIAQSFIETGNLVNLGKNDAGTVSLSKILADLQTKAQRAVEFMRLLQQLTAQGLSQTSLQQLLDAGPDAALETAQAIAAGGTSAIAQINALTGQIATAGAGLGGQMAQTFYGAGIQAAQGLVAGLESEGAKLDRIAKRLADQLVDAIKKKLGIKSPSTVFKGIGQDAVRGLGIGLDEVYVRRQGTRLAASLATGFGRPALEAYLSSGGAGQAVQVTADVKLSAEQANDLAMGHSIQMRLDAWRSVGGRSHQ
jgi:TP901 family phage tail tape measure protein